MRAKIIAAIALVVAVIGVAVPASAFGFYEAKESGAAAISSDEKVSGTAFLAGNTVSSKAEVDGDIFCAGNDVTIDGTVKGDVICGANTIKINGTVEGDVRLAATAVTINGEVTGSATIGASSVTLSEGGKIGTDATITAGSITIDGDIARDALLYGSLITMNGTVGRDVQLEASQLTFSDDAKIGGALRYSLDSEMTIDDAIVTGDTEYYVTNDKSNNSDMYFGAMLFGLLATVILALAVQMLAPRYTKLAVKSEVNFAAKALLVGVVASVLVLFIIAILFATVVAWPVALAVIFLYGFGATIAIALSSKLVGMWIVPKSQPLVQALIGAVTLGAVALIPVLGWLVIALAFLIGLGMFIISLKYLYAEQKVEKNDIVSGTSDGKKTKSKKPGTKKSDKEEDK